MRIEELYGLLPSEFTRARNSLAKSLKASGRPAQARDVQALKKPSKAAWAVNQLARWRSDDVDELIDAAARLGKAHRALLAGNGDAGAVRDADRGEKAILARLVEAASSYLEDAKLGATAATLRAVEQTLHALALGGKEQHQLLRDGTLTDEVEVEAGFGPTDVKLAKKPRATAARKTDGASEKPAAPKLAKPKVDRRAKAREERLRKRLDRLRDAAEKAEAAAERAREKVAEAEAELREL